MAYNFLPFWGFRAIDENGDPIVGAKVFTYEPGTATKKTSYDKDGVANTNPVVTDSYGQADIFLDGSYKIILATSTAADPPVGADILFTWDNVQGAASEAVIAKVVTNLAGIGTGETDGELAIDQATGNTYTWDSGNSKWRIMSGNIYSTAGLPVAATYTIETGTFVMDTTTNGIKRWNGSAWVSAGSSGVLTAQGDILYASAANTLERLAKGTATQVLAINSGATAPEWITGAKVVQMVSTEDAACTEVAGNIPYDDTIPDLSSEGAEFMSLAITPLSTSNNLLIIVNANFGHDDAGTDTITVCLSKDSDAAPLDAVSQVAQAASIYHFTLIDVMAAPSTSAITFKVFAGAVTGNATLNGFNATRRLGGAMKSSMVIMEIA